MVTVATEPLSPPERFNHCSRILRGDEARTGAIEIKAQHVRAGGDGRARVREIRDAADFYFESTTWFFS